MERMFSRMWEIGMMEMELVGVEDDMVNVHMSPIEGVVVEWEVEFQAPQYHLILRCIML